MDLSALLDLVGILKTEQVPDVVGQGQRVPADIDRRQPLQRIPRHADLDPVGLRGGFDDIEVGGLGLDDAVAPASHEIGQGGRFRVHCGSMSMD